MYYINNKKKKLKLLNEIHSSEPQAATLTQFLWPPCQKLLLLRIISYPLWFVVVKSLRCFVPGPEAVSGMWPAPYIFFITTWWKRTKVTVAELKLIPPVYGNTVGSTVRSHTRCLNWGPQHGMCFKKGQRSNGREEVWGLSSYVSSPTRSQYTSDFHQTSNTQSHDV